MGLIESAKAFGKKVGDSVDAFNTKNKTLLAASAANTIDAPVAPLSISPPSTSGDANLNSLANSMLAKADRGFYGHMTIEKCYQMSRTKGELRSDKSSFAKSTCNGMNIGKKGK